MGLKRKGAQDASFSLSAIGLLVGKDEVDHCGFILANRDFFLPDSWIREDGPLNSALGQYIEYSLLPQNFPTLVPGHDLIFSSWHVRELEPSTFVGHCVVRMGNYQDLRIHPSVPAITPQVN